MSVFETLAVRQGRVIFADEHLTRLRQAAAAAGFFMPESFPLPPEMDGGDGMLRLYVTAGDGGPLEPADDGRVYALWEEMRFPTSGDIARGLRIGICRAPVSGALGGWKTGNYWSHVQALAEARHQGLDENLLFNPGGALVSAAMANVFLWMDGAWQTPALESGARDGVLRAWVAGQVKVVESIIQPEDLAGVEACVLTNSRLGVMPVTEIDGRPLEGRGKAQDLASAYCDDVFTH
jgi:branched-subunit amino acid aminotransferase/4-amino-4-deoxychorismate lyase